MYVQFRITLLSVLAAVLCSTIPACAQTVQEQVLQPAPIPASAAPANPEQLPPNPPTLIYDNGFLIISAHNSTLGDILRGIRGLTGADIEVPPQADERVFVRLGPALPRDILRSLLAGSRFNYLIVGSDTDPNRLAKVLLFPKPGTENPPQPLTNAAVAAPRALSPQSNVVEAVSEEPQEGEPPVRAQQRMLQQRRQTVMQELQQSRQSD